MYQSKNVSLFELAEGKDSKERDLHSLLTVYFTRVLKNHGENSNIKIYVYLNAVDHTKKVRVGIYVQSPKIVFSSGDDGLPSNFLEWSVLTVCFQIERKLL